MGASVLMRPTLAPFAAGALEWLVAFGEGSSRQNMVFAHLHEIGGTPFATGAFVVPGIIFLAQARQVFSALKREERRRRRRSRRA